MKVFIICITLFCNVLLVSITIEIPTDYPTIQLGIDNSINGDIVLILPGTYYENLNYNGKNIIVTSLFHTTQDSSYIEQTIIDGNANGRVVMFESGETADAKLIGLTITNGYPLGGVPQGCGGGIQCYYSSPILEDLVVINNTSDNDGGGIYCLASNAEINRCTITENTGLADVGGICAVTESEIKIIDTMIIENQTNGDGGAFGSSGYSHTLFINCLLDNNIANDNGGGLFLTLSSMEMYSSIVSNNNSMDGAGGLDLWDAGAIIDKSVFCLNGSHIYSGGISAYLSSNLELKNTIVAHNVGYGLQGFSNVSYCDFFDNSSGNFYECDPSIGDIVSINFNSDPCDIYNNILLDPDLTNYPAGNFHLNPTSPCIDAGDPGSPLDPDGSITDIGKYFCNQANFILAEFEATPLSGFVPLEVQFTDLSFGNVTNWEWDFNNDGITDSYDQNPLYTFTIPDICTVNLTVYNDINSDSETKTEYINASGPVAEFETIPISGYAPLDVQFIDLSTGNITCWEWDFNNDGSIDSNEQNPIFTYSEIDSFTVSLTVYYEGYSDEQTIENCIVTYDHVNCNFTAIPTNGLAPLTVQFTDISTGSISIRQWDFNNDGVIDSNELNPTCTYYNSGSYAVHLFVSDGLEYDSELKLDYITVTSTGSGDIPQPQTTKLLGNYPNPFNPTTFISFEVKESEIAELSIFNIKGQIIYHGQFSNGCYQMPWHTSSSSSGVYFYKLSSESYSKINKMILLK
jgi:predicted outer membrane repeat protein